MNSKETAKLVVQDIDYKRRGSMMPKMGTFDGVSATIESFMQQFENHSFECGWNEADRLFQLRHSLEKDLMTVLVDGTKIETCNDLMAALRSRYGTADQEERFQSELKTRRRKKGEDLQTVFQDIKRLMALAFGPSSGKLAEYIAISAFVDTFGDKELTIKVLEKAPKTLEEAYQAAVRYEALKKRTEHLSSGAMFDASGRKPEKALNSIETMKYHEDVRDINKKKILELKQSIDSIKGVMEQLKLGGQQQQQLHTPPQGGRPQFTVATHQQPMLYQPYGMGGPQVMQVPPQFTYGPQQVTWQQQPGNWNNPGPGTDNMTGARSAAPGHPVTRSPGLDQAQGDQGGAQ